MNCFVQAGLDVTTSAVCIAILWFGLTNIGSAFLILFIFGERIGLISPDDRYNANA
jgi:hypothetical protein